MASARSHVRWCLLGTLTVALGACPENDGTLAPPDQFFFPVAAVIGGGGNTLYVVNSDFDLRYNGGTVLSIDLDLVRRRVREGNGGHCIPDADQPGAVLCAAGYFVRTAATRRVSAFAVDMAYARYPDRQRLYIAVRGDGSVTWLDTNDNGGLECGGEGANPFCDGAHRVGVDPSQSPVGARLPPDPSGVSVDPARGWVVVSHQSTDPNLARATLFRDNAFLGASQGSAPPTLLNVVGGVAPGLAGLVLLPRAASDNSRSTWIAVSRNEASLTFFQAYPGNRALSDALPFLYRSAAVGVTGLNSGGNNRSIALDPRPGSNRAFVVGRSPEALLTVTFDPGNPTSLRVAEAVPVSPGPSRLAVTYDPVRQQTLVYVVSYDARRITVVDPDARRAIARIHTRRGPHQIVRDPVMPLLYVLDFLDGSVEVIDLRPTRDDGTANPNYQRRVIALGQLPAVGT